MVTSGLENEKSTNITQVPCNWGSTERGDVKLKGPTSTEGGEVWVRMDGIMTSWWRSWVGSK